MCSKYQENSSAKKIPSFITIVMVLIIQGIVTSASADEVVAGFERMLNPVETTGQPTVVHQSERDPLYTMVNAALWSAPANDANIAAGFEHMLNPVETSGQPNVAYRKERDPLYIMVNTRLWSVPVFQGNVRVAFIAYAQP